MIVWSPRKKVKNRIKVIMICTCLTLELTREVLLWLSKEIKEGFNRCLLIYNPMHWSLQREVDLYKYFTHYITKMAPPIVKFKFETQAWVLNEKTKRSCSNYLASFKQLKKSIQEVLVWVLSFQRKLLRCMMETLGSRVSGDQDLLSALKLVSCSVMTSRHNYNNLQIETH